ncbi:AbrB family transcriptional regulator [Ectopseudomonas mendocina]|uniref:AbrB family transcriptional regulator n=1 Tax=Ectopseudomonas mendocina TaxID=300 RepID=A0ABZ2RG18_ECTME
MPDPHENPKHIRNWWLTPLVGGLGGYLASLIGWPLPWIIGSLLAVILFRCFGPAIREIPGGRQTGQWLVSTSIGLHFTYEVFQQVITHLPLIIIGSLGTLALSLIGIVILRRGGTDKATAFFASMPGGATEMVNMARGYDADSARIAAAHSLRLLMVVLLIPALFTWSLPAVQPPQPAEVNWPWLLGLLFAGAVLARVWRLLKQPSPWMLGPIIVSATASVVFNLHLGLPSWLGHVGQWLIGCALGCHFSREFFRTAPAFMTRIFVFSLLAIAGAALLGLGLGWISGVESVSLMLGLMPGGITELSLTAEALHLSVAMVSALQILRLFLQLFLARPVFNLWLRKGEKA